MSACALHTNSSVAIFNTLNSAPVRVYVTKSHLRKVHVKASLMGRTVMTPCGEGVVTNFRSTDKIFEVTLTKWYATRVHLCARKCKIQGQIHVEE